MKSGANLKVAVVGSRKFNNLPLLMMAVDKLNPAMIVSGGAQGADSLGQIYAKMHGLVMVVYYPDWTEGRGAALRRNVMIANAADVCVAFPIGASTGTRHCIHKFEYYKKPVYVLECDENSQLIM
jgi:threonine/homoserine efflux transporter RhtA